MKIKKTGSKIHAGNYFWWALVFLSIITANAYFFVLKQSTLLTIFLFNVGFFCLLVSIQHIKKGIKYRNFLLDSYSEIKKIIWIPKQELLYLTFIVLLIIFISAVIIYCLDLVSMTCIRKILV